MKVIVLVKQVLDPEAKISLGEGGSVVFEERFNLNYLDEFAVEEALRIKEASEGVSVTAVTLGPKKAIEALRTCIAMGVERAFLLEVQKYEMLDPSLVAKVLSKFAQNEGFDLILCGERAMDDENGVVGSLVAANLGVPFLGSVTKITLADGSRIVAECEMDGTSSVYETMLPAVVSVRKGINEPRVPAVTGVMKAMRASIPTIDASSLLEGYASKVHVVSYELPKRRGKVKIVEGKTPEEKVKNLIQLLREEAKVL